MSTPQIPCRVRLRVAEGREAVALAVATQIVSSTAPPYEGAYEVIPGEEPQVLPTAGTLAGRDIVIGAIPQNYGKITWDGNIITVS